MCATSTGKSDSVARPVIRHRRSSLSITLCLATKEMEFLLSEACFICRQHEKLVLGIPNAAVFSIHVSSAPALANGSHPSLFPLTIGAPVIEDEIIPFLDLVLVPPIHRVQRLPLRLEYTPADVPVRGNHAIDIGIHLTLADGRQRPVRSRLKTWCMSVQVSLHHARGYGRQSNGKYGEEDETYRRVGLDGSPEAQAENRNPIS